MSDLIRKNDALDILCKFCGITEDVEKCRKTSADGWCKEYCELKNMPTVDAIPIEWIEIDIEESAFSGYDMHAYEVATMLEEWKEKERKEE